MKKSVKIILLIFIILIVVLLTVRIGTNLIYTYKYESCMKHEPSPIYDNETSTWINSCPDGCKLGSCFGVRTACCPE